MSLPCATNLNKPRHMLIWPRRLHINYFLTCENGIVWCLSLLWLSSWIVCYVHTFHFVFAMCVGFRGINWPECKCLSHCIRWYNVRIQTVCKMAGARGCGGVDVVLKVKVDWMIYSYTRVEILQPASNVQGVYLSCYAFLYTQSVNCTDCAQGNGLSSTFTVP